MAQCLRQLQPYSFILIYTRGKYVTGTVTADDSLPLSRVLACNMPLPEFCCDFLHYCGASHCRNCWQLKGLTRNEELKKHS